MPDRTSAVIKVGGGRGFIIEADRRRYVITAAHCLPKLPPAHAAAYTVERTFRHLLGPIGRRRPTVWAECVFVDPIADIAVLAEPDGQAFFDEYGPYLELTEQVEPFVLGSIVFAQETRRTPAGHEIPTAPHAKVHGEMLSLKQQWFACEAESVNGKSLWVKGDAPIESGMSGSPILGPAGAAIGVVSVSDQRGEGGPNPLLMDVLPGWLLRACDLLVIESGPANSGGAG